MSEKSKYVSDQPPTKIVEPDSRDSREIYVHPAYGLISISTIMGGEKTLFGSDLAHDHRICIRISRAEEIRNLSSDHAHETERVVEVEMSAAQFAQLITSGSCGQGTPCTFRAAPPEGTDIQLVPGIERVESKGEVFSREIQKAAREQIAQLQESVNAFGELLNSNSPPSKTKLKGLHREIKSALELLPGHMGFVVKSAEEAMATIASHAKIEVESYVKNLAERFGHERIGQLKTLGLTFDKQSDDGEHSNRDGSQS